jgi:hypothetical protein
MVTSWPVKVIVGTPWRKAERAARLADFARRMALLLLLLRRMQAPFTASNAEKLLHFAGVKAADACKRHC